MLAYADQMIILPDHVAQPEAFRLCCDALHHTQLSQWTYCQCVRAGHAPMISSDISQMTFKTDSAFGSKEEMYGQL